MRLRDPCTVLPAAMLAVLACALIVLLLPLLEAELGAYNATPRVGASRVAGYCGQLIGRLDVRQA